MELKDNIFEIEFRKKISKENDKLLLDNPSCQICKVEKSAMITIIGKRLACCNECNNNIHKQLKDNMNQKREADELFGYC